VNLDSKALTHLLFSTSDSTGKYRVVIEGIDDKDSRSDKSLS